MQKQMTEIETSTLEVPGAVLTYDIRRNESSTKPALLIIGSPMGAAGFKTLAGHFDDRTVVTYDPRGADRSTKVDPSSQSTPDDHADDLHRLIEALEIRPVDLFASSGGAVNALALVAQHPEQVKTLVAHEPPAALVLPDGEEVLVACRDVRDTYMRDGFGPGMAKFIAMVSFEGPFPADYIDRPAPDPAMFGLPTQDDGSRIDVLLRQNIVTCNDYQHDFDALRSASTRIVLGVGQESSNVMAGRAGAAFAERLGQAPVMFPGGHDGFSGGEYGPPAKPDEFAAKLREILDGNAA